MNKLLATLGVLSALLPFSASAFSLQAYEADTKVAARLISGQLDERLIELGSNAQTKEFVPIMAGTIKRGVEAYCRFYQRAIGAASDKCSRTITVTAPNGTFSF